jgi:hypothetical protein
MHDQDIRISWVPRAPDAPDAPPVDIEIIFFLGEINLFAEPVICSEPALERGEFC